MSEYKKWNILTSKRCLGGGGGVKFKTHGPTQSYPLHILHRRKGIQYIIIHLVKIKQNKDRKRYKHRGR
jgi:hypothetical protein